MALAKQETTKDKQKQTNKEAIQNINRTGTVSGQKSNAKNISAPIPKANNNTSNLSGANNIANARGKVVTSPTGNSAPYVSDYSTATKTNTSITKGKLEQYQPVLSSMADSSTKKANQILDSLSKAFGAFSQVGQNNQDYYNQMRQQRFEKSRQKEYAKNDAERNRLNSETTQEDFQKFYNPDNSPVDFDTPLKDLLGKKASLENIVSTSENEGQKLSAQAELDEVNRQMEELDLLKQKREAYEESANLDYLKNNDESAYKSYRELISHKDDSMWERAGTATAHLLTQTANEVPTLVDQFEFMAKSSTARQGIDEIEAAYQNKEIDTDEYVKALADVDDRIKQAQQDYNDSVSQEIRKVVDQYGAQTYIGANDVDKFILQAGESTAQFLLHFAISKGIASVAYKGNAIKSAGEQFVTETFGEEALKGMAEDEIMKQGLNVLGGNIAVHTMSAVGMAEKVNQLLDEGYPIETAFANGLFTYLTSTLTEKIGMDGLVESLGTRVSTDIFGAVLRNRMIAGSLSEGGEEFVEGIIDPFIDSITLGKDYEVNGNELLMAFLLGGASGGAMSGGAVAINTVQTGIQVNQMLKQNSQVRGNTVALNEAVRNIGKLVINDRKQLNMAKSEMELLSRNYSTMTPVQKQIYHEISEIYNEAVATYEAKSAMKGVEFASDEVITPASEECEKIVNETIRPDINHEAQQINELNNLQESVNQKIDQVIATEEGVRQRTQKMLTEGGYDIDADVFNSLETKAQNEALVAMDAARVLKLNVAVTNDDGIRQVALQNNPSISQEQLQKIIDGTSGLVLDDGRIVVNGSKRPILYTLTHEMTHGTESSKYYPQLKELVKGAYGENWDGAVEEKANIYDAVQSFNSEEERIDNAEKEVVARFVEDKLGNEDFINDLVRYNYSLASKMYQDLQAFGNTDETIRIRNAFEKAFADNHQQEGMNFSFVKDSEFDSLQYELAKDVKGELPPYVVAEIRNNLALNKARGHGTAEWNGYIFSIYSSGYGDFKITDYNKIDDNETVGTVKNRTRRTIGSSELANDGNFGYAPEPREDIVDDEVAGREQRNGLRIDGFGKSGSENQKSSSHEPNRGRGPALTRKQYNQLAQEYLARHNGKKHFSFDLTEASDIYNEAVKRNDTEIAQQIVDETAKENGYDIKAYHGTNEKFTEFSNQRAGKNFNNYLRYGEGFYFAPSAEETKKYGKNTMAVYLSANRLLDASKPVENEKAYQYLIDNGYHPGDARFAMNYGDRFVDTLYDILLKEYSQGGANAQVQSLLREFGYDGVVAYYGANNEKGEVVVFDPSQIKSADPITYDDNGNIIPLEERFNQKTNDLRYSYDAEDATINKEYSDDFKELQASSQEIVNRNGWDDESRYTDANISERLSEVLRNELESRNYSNGNPDGLLENTGEYEILKDVDGQTFHDVFEIVRAHLKFGECVDLHPVESNEDWTGYNDTTNYLSTDGLSGFSITKDGDLISVFNFNDKKKGFLRSIAPFIREHARSLDCYVIDKAYSGSKVDLQQLYHDIFGFETREVVDYDYQYDHDGIGKRYGDPKIAFMYNPNLETAQATNETNELTVDDDALPVTKKIPDAKDMANKDVAQVLKEMPKPEGKENILHRAKLLAQRCLVDRYSAVNDIAKEYKNPKLIHLTDKVMRSSAMANNAIYSGIFDSEGKTKIGKSLTEIMGQIPEDSKQLFYEYMYHYRNIDDMSMVERFGEGYEDRPVFGESVTAEDSQDRVEQIEKEHPEFKQWAEDLWEMNRQLLKMRMDAGIISQETYDKFTTERPHYVKIARENKSSSGATVLNPNDIKKFKGSTKNILPLDETMKNHILSTYRVCNNNELNSEIIQTVGGEEVFDPDSMDDLIESEFNPLGEDPNSKRLYAYKDGKKYSIPIGEELYQSLAAKTPNNAVTKVLDNTVAKLSNWRKSLLTSKNPLFSLFSNPIKDFQDAIRNTKYLSKYPGSLIEAVHQIITNGEFSQQYDNLGIRSSQYMGQDMADALREMESDKGLKKFWNNLAELGENIEKAPRLAEFIAALKSGKSVDEAAYDAAEVTTNFKRGGTTAKTMDKYGFTFLNASIQGFDKQVRNAQRDIETIRKNGVKGAISVMAQLTLAGGIPLRMLLDWLWKDDDEYEELSDYVKNNYYIVGKANGRFIRIPKGRIAAFYQTVTDNAYKTVTDQVNAWDALLDDWQSFNDNVAPNNFMDNNLFSPLTQVATGKTWYGEDLIPARLQDIPDYEQFDESTDALSIAIGQLSKKVADKVGSDNLQISPYEFNYLLDQYTGIIGDVLIPATSLKTSVGVENPLAKGVATAVLDKFTTDPILKNQNVTSFYDLKGVIDTRAAGSAATEEELLASKYLGTVGSAMGKLYGEKRAIQMDKTLSNKEKLEKTREIQTQINDLAREALANYDNIDKTEKYASIGGVQYYKDDNGEWVKPTKTALEKLNNAGLDEEDRGKYFDTYSKVNDIRKTIKSQTPEGKTADYRKATIDAINNSGMSDKGKNTMFDSYYSSKAVDHINSMELTDKQKYDLKVANKMAEGQKDENGKTISNSKARATAEAYKKLGLLEDVLKYIKDNNVSPSELGLSKTVYKELTGGASYSTAYAKSMSKKSSSKSSKTASKSSTPKVKVGGSTGKKQAILANPVKSTLNSYLNAYSNVFRGSTAKGSTGNATVTCPRCHNQVSSATGRCPVCGANL